MYKKYGVYYEVLHTKAYYAKTISSARYEATVLRNLVTEEVIAVHDLEGLEYVPTVCNLFDKLDEARKRVSRIQVDIDNFRENCMHVVGLQGPCAICGSF